MRTLQMATAALVATTWLAAPGLGQTVVKDHVTDPAAWSDDAGGVLDHFLDPEPALSAAFGIAITGNGERLSRVGVIFGHGSLMGEPNGGDINELRWRFRFFENPADFSLGSLSVAAPHPNWEAVFESPSNPDWTLVIGSFLGAFDLRYAEVDVSELDIVTTTGQTHLVVLVPESRLSTPATIAVMAMSGGGGGTIGTEPDWYERGEWLGATGPDSLANLEENWIFTAAKVETAPDAQCEPPTAASADRTIICGGQSVHLSALPGTGGDTVDWYSGGCGVNQIATGSPVLVNPGAGTTYFARTRNSSTGCVSDLCTSVGPIEVRPYVPADFLQDCDVDGDDLRLFAACSTGPATPYDPAALPAPEPGCTLTPDAEGHIAADLDKDDDVDMDDFGVFQRCFSGENVPADLNCAMSPD